MNFYPTETPEEYDLEGSEPMARKQSVDARNKRLEQRYNNMNSTVDKEEERADLASEDYYRPTDFVRQNDGRFPQMLAKDDKIMYSLKTPNNSVTGGLISRTRG